MTGRRCRSGSNNKKRKVSARRSPSLHNGKALWLLNMCLMLSEREKKRGGRCD